MSDPKLGIHTLSGMHLYLTIPVRISKIKLGKVHC